MDLQRRRKDLLQTLGATAGISLVLVLAFGSYGFYRVFSGFVLRSAEANSVQLCRIVVDEMEDQIFMDPKGDRSGLKLVTSGYAELDEWIRPFMARFDILKVKIYDTERRVRYCTDPRVVGKVESGNARLEASLAGRVDAQLESRYQLGERVDEAILDVDIVETYVPILTRSQRVLGSFATFTNVTGYQRQIRSGVAVATSILGLALAGAFGLSFWLIRESARRIRETQDRLEHLAMTDLLTGIHNRGYVLERGVQEFERARRSGPGTKTPLGCILLDIDHFKTINDTLGHAAGDDVLKHFAECLRANVRPYDIFGRYGGEEFLILMPDAGLEQALVAAYRICDRVREEAFLAAGKPLRITASLGVAEARSAESLDGLIKLADEGLYRAKAEGRDRVAWIS